jgi:TonB family protein
VALLATAALLHVVLLVAFGAWGPRWSLGMYERPVSVTVLQGHTLDGDEVPGTLPDVAIADAEAPEMPEEEVQEPELPDGQIVDTPAPDVEKTPLQADYLAEHDNAVPEETRTRAFEVNPEVLANRYSEESRVQLEEAADLGASEQSTGATAGGIDDPAIGKGPPRSMLPSMFALTNKEGIAAPTRASSSTQSLQGAPQNDRLDEPYGDTVALNTREFAGAEYWNRVKAMVNFYWKQNIDNLSPSLRLSKSRYITVVDVVLDGDGGLERISVTRDSGSEPVDVALLSAFRTAAPFPGPPEQLVASDGRVYLGRGAFEVGVGHAEMRFQGVDPRAGVQFPGILNAPR